MTNLQNPFWIQLGWVFKTYFSSWRGVGLALCMLIMARSSLRLGAEPKLEPQYSLAYAANPATEDKSFERIDAYRAQLALPAEKRTTAINLIYLFGHIGEKKLVRDELGQSHIEWQLPDDRFYAALDEFPNIRAVAQTRGGLGNGYSRLGSYLAKLPFLEDIELDQAELLAALVVAGPPAKLRRVEVNFSLDQAVIENLQQLPALDTLVLDRLPHDDGVQALTKLPHLATLIVNEKPATSVAIQTNPQLREAEVWSSFVAMVACPTLRTIHFGGYREDPPSILANLSRSLPSRISVGPAVYRDMQAAMLLRHLMDFALFLIGGQLVCLEVWTRFRMPGSRLIPGFARGHLAAASVFCAWWVAFGTRLLVAMDARFWGALVFISFVCAALQRVRQFPPWPSQNSKSILWTQLKSVSFLCLALPLMTVRGRDLLLTGYHPGVWLAMALATAWVLASAARQLQNAEIVDEPSTARTKRPRWEIQFANEKNWSLRLRFRRLESLSTKFCEMSWWQQVRHWSLGTAPVLFMLLRSLSMISVMLLLVMWFWSKTDFRLDNLLGFPFGIAELSFTTFHFEAWRQRTRSLPAEILRPQARRTLQRQWIAVVGCEMAMLISLCLAAFLFGLVALPMLVLNYEPDLKETGLTLLVLWFGGFLCGVTLHLVTFAIQRSRLMLVVWSFVFFYYAAVFVIPIAEYRRVPFDPLHEWLLLPLHWKIIVASLPLLGPAMMAGLYWQWRRREIDPRF
jgi:hypothetical protein